ncbi:hypothetical protein [Mumia sp. DW29H23]|uniref:hypothetical protein n=1 Tax=Mumia sp. DW29H23 TaxID=3421241 RepID=UPI003D692AA5
MRRLVVRPRLAAHRTRVAVAASLTALAMGATACGESSPDDDAAADATATTAPTTSPTTSASEPTPSPTASDAPPSTTPPTTAPTPGATEPTASPQALAAAARGPVGVWRNRELKWVLRIRKGGRFVEDFDGVKNIRSGTWRRKGTVVVLKGGDGVTTRGKLTRNTLTIRGTVLKRVR